MTATPGCDDNGVTKVNELETRDPRIKAGQRDSGTRGELLRGGVRPPMHNIVRFVDAHRGRSGVELLCSVLRSAGLGGRGDFLRRQDPPALDAGAV